MWILCIAVRLSIPFIIDYFYKFNNKITKYIAMLLLFVGSFFLYKAIFGSNNEIQIAKVFWHETRYVHSALYLLAGLYLFHNNIIVTKSLLFTDLYFSIVYRLISGL